MRIHDSYRGLDDDARGAVVAIGNFDGIHLGHRAVITFAQSEARLRGTPSAVLTFHPHPRRFFAPDAPRFELAPLRSKARHLYELGLDHLYVLPFADELRRLTAEEFVADVLCEGLGIAGAVVGSDFRFGANRQGDIGFLQEAGRKRGFSVHHLAPVTAPGGAVYSSSNVRSLLREGRPEEARVLLGRSWGLHGNVVTGDAWARSHGLDVALDISEYMQPRPGVYAAWAGFEAGGDIDWRPAAAMVRGAADGRRIEPSLALLLAKGGNEQSSGRVWVSFEKYLEDVAGEKDPAEAASGARRWRDAALGFLGSDLGGGTRPPTVSLSRARHVASLNLD